MNFNIKKKFTNKLIRFYKFNPLILQAEGRMTTQISFSIVLVNRLLYFLFYKTYVYSSVHVYLLGVYIHIAGMGSTTTYYLLSKTSSYRF